MKGRSDVKAVLANPEARLACDLRDSSVEFDAPGVAGIALIPVCALFEMSISRCAGYSEACGRSLSEAC
ncbi:hypothetical protein HPB52_002895 [Rhipicephalus sanguineus]|uniref:Uncharacterized protein n=1 Tax=Rhipicephalus sanguineus TaxID=34632 RepID=A0A9D4PV72_RHISA|nr:hypothetical protein HPB52_002895 [Rhipicephalus sanguineus]